MKLEQKNLNELKKTDKKIITELIDSSFKEQKRKLIKDYWNKIKEKKPIVYSCSDNLEMHAAAVIYKEKGFNYLCKFAVSPQKKNNGVGKKLMKEIAEKHKEEGIAWRTSKENSDAIKFYEKLFQYLKQGKKLGEKKDYIIYGIRIENNKEKTVSEISKINPTIIPI